MLANKVFVKEFNLEELLCFLFPKTILAYLSSYFNCFHFLCIDPCLSSRSCKINCDSRSFRTSVRQCMLLLQLAFQASKTLGFGGIQNASASTGPSNCKRYCDLTAFKTSSSMLSFCINWSFWPTLGSGLVDQGEIFSMSPGSVFSPSVTLIAVEIPRPTSCPQSFALLRPIVAAVCFQKRGYASCTITHGRSSEHGAQQRRRCGLHTTRAGV